MKFVFFAFNYIVLMLVWSVRIQFLKEEILHLIEISQNMVWSFVILGFDRVFFATFWI
jgi:hypothetical protein